MELASDENLASIDGQLISECATIVNLNTDTSLVDNGALSVEISTLKVQICYHLQARAFWHCSRSKFLKYNE